MSFVWAFAVGGALCALAQLVVDVGRLTPAHTMVLFVCLGALASALGVYGPLVQVAGAGATVPLTGFGHTLVQGVLAGISREGLVGLLTGGIQAAGAGLTAAILFGVLAALVFHPKG
ncbi:MAG: stage V sporulation protein AE [Clostridia bacterium]|nr:stage V sporulation protein AE [Clostridia bacterium]